LNQLIDAALKSKKKVAFKNEYKHYFHALDFYSSPTITLNPTLILELLDTTGFWVHKVVGVV